MGVSQARRWEVSGEHQAHEALLGRTINHR